jgi:hypothetical protein
MTNKNKKLSLFLILSLCSFSVTAQDLSAADARNFSWQAVIPTTPHNGLYNIQLDPLLLSKSQKSDYADFRIYQNKKTEVPYLLRKQESQFDIPAIKSFPVVENKQLSNGASSFIFSNEKGESIDHFTLMLKNSWVKKHLHITGSNDLKQWYGLVPEFVFDPANPNINTPLTDYKYIRLFINDSGSAPLNITGVGQYYSERKATVNLPVPSAGMTIKNVNKTTVIKLAFANKYVIDNLSFTISAPALYKRQAWVNGESFTLTSAQPNEVTLFHEVKTDTLVIRIENQDNPPLKIAEVKAWQVPRYLTAYLEAGNSYLILTGDAHLTKPQYDLSFFEDSLNKALPLIGMTDAAQKPINKPALQTAVAKGFTLFSSKLWIWIAIVGIIALLGFMAFRMLRDMQEKK